MTRLIIAVCIALAASLCLAAVSSAHKVNIFAYVDGNSVVTDSGYSRSQRVHDGVVEVYDAASGTLLLSGKTDNDGKFSFDIPAQARESKMDLRLLLKAGTGHQADWTVRYAEYGEAEAPAAKAEPVQKDVEKSVVENSSIMPVAPPTPVMDQAALEKMIKKTVRRELEPVKGMLAELSQPGPSVTEIVGGIGYILGLFGIVAYMKSRRSE